MSVAGGSTSSLAQATSSTSWSLCGSFGGLQFERFSAPLVATGAALRRWIRRLWSTAVVGVRFGPRVAAWHPVLLVRTRVVLRVSYLLYRGVLSVDPLGVPRVLVYLFNICRGLCVQKKKPAHYPFPGEARPRREGTAFHFSPRRRPRQGWLARGGRLQGRRRRSSFPLAGDRGRGGSPAAGGSRGGRPGGAAPPAARGGSRSSRRRMLPRISSPSTAAPAEVDADTQVLAGDRDSVPRGGRRRWRGSSGGRRDGAPPPTARGGGSRGGA